MAEVIVCLSHEDPFRVTLSVFCAENDFGPDQRDEIELALAQNGHFRGGGGAAPVYIVTEPPEAWEPRWPRLPVKAAA